MKSQCELKKNTKSNERLLPMLLPAQFQIQDISVHVIDMDLLFLSDSLITLNQ